MLPPNVRRIGCLAPMQGRPANFQGRVCTFHYPDGVPVHIVCEMGPDQGVMVPDYRGKWGKVPLLYGWRIDHPAVSPQVAFVIYADAPDLAHPFKFVCIETNKIDHFEIYWWRALESMPSLKEVAADVAKIFFMEA